MKTIIKSTIIIIGVLLSATIYNSCCNSDKSFNISSIKFEDFTIDTTNYYTFTMNVKSQLQWVYNPTPSLFINNAQADAIRFCPDVKSTIKTKVVDVKIYNLKSSQQNQKEDITDKMIVKLWSTISLIDRMNKIDEGPGVYLGFKTDNYTPANYQFLLELTLNNGKIISDTSDIIFLK